MKPSAPQLLYALKLYLSAMLAYALAVNLGLLNPYWAMVTACVLSNPVSGAVRARATYRLGGTLFAGALTLLMSAYLSNAPQMLVICSGLSAAAMLGASHLDRTPRAYFFQLGALTMMLVAIAYINHPDTMFHMVVTRVTEICLGIVSVTLVDSLLFPSSLAPVLRERLKGWLPDMLRWQEDCLDGKPVDAQTELDRIRTLGDIASFSQLMSTLSYDSSVDRTTRQAAATLQQRLLSLVPLLSAIGNALADLPETLRQPLRPYLAEVRHQARSETPNHERLAGLLPDTASLSAWERLIVDALHDHIHQYLELWAEARQLDAFLDGEPLPLELHERVRQARAFPLPADTDMATRMFAGILATYTLLCLLWYFTGWEQGANMVLLGVVAIAFFGSGDEPGYAISHFGRFALIAMGLGFVLGYVLLPLASDYTSFLLVMALFLLPLGAWAAINPLATLAIALSLSSINFQGHYAPYDLGFFLESTCGTLVGVYCAFMCAALFRRWGAQPILDRLERQDRRALQRLNAHANEQELARYQNTTLDRITAQAPRLAAIGQGAEIPNLLARLEAGINLATLRLASANGQEPAVLTSELWQHPLPRDEQTQRRLLDQLDAGLDAAWQRHDSRQLRPLTWLRLRLFPNAADWSPRDDR